MSQALATDFSHRVRVYWEDTDAGGVVFYANYLKFFERARTEWLRTAGVAQQALRERSGAIFIVSDTALRYLAPARLDDLLHISVLPVQAGKASMTLLQQARLDSAQGPLLCEGRIRIGCVDAQRFRPRRFPDEVAALLAPLAMSASPASPAPPAPPVPPDPPASAPCTPAAAAG